MNQETIPDGAVNLAAHHINGRSNKNYSIHVMACPPKTGPNVMLESERETFRRRRVNGLKKVHIGKGHLETPQKLQRV